MEFREYTVEELVRLNMLEKPMDGNHGGKHPTSKDYVKKGIPFIMVSDINNGKINYNTCKYISKSTRNGLDKGFSKPNDVLLSHKATIGLTAIVGEEFEEIVLTPQITYYRVIKGINNRYLKYYFDSAYFQNILSSWATSGSTRAYLGITAQLKLPIILPDINIQNKIAKMLSDIDKKIELNNQINDNLLELSQQLFFKYFCNDDKTNFVKEVTLKEFCNIKYGKGLPTKNILTEGFPVYGGNGIIGFYNQKMYDESQVLVSCRGAASGKVIFTKPKCFVTNNSLVLECDRKHYYYLKELSLRNPYYSYTTGSAQPQITIDNIKDINIKVPSDDVLNEYNSIAEQIEKKYFMNIDQNETLEQLRDTLLPKLMSGEIDLDKIEI